MIILALLLASSCYAKELLITSEYPNYSDITLQVLEYNAFYHDDYIIGDMFTDYRLILLDSNSNSLYEGALGDTVTMVDFDDRIRKIMIKDDSTGTTLASQNVSFCDYDGVCEPCVGPGCELVENYLTCSDCPSGSNDGFCDKVLDGFCDPDCQDQEYDCPSCEPFCDYTGASCEDIGGVICEEGTGCSGGYFAQGLIIDGVKVENCCVNGFCGNAEEQLEVDRQMAYYPENFEIPDDEPAAEGSCSDRGGVLCDYEQDCDGKWDFYIPPDDSAKEEGVCCQGTCITPNDLLLGDPGFKAKFEDGPAKPSPEEQLKLLGPQDQFVMPRELPPGVEKEFTEEELEQYKDGEILFSTDGSTYVKTSDGIDPDAVVNKQEFVDQRAGEFEDHLEETERLEVLAEKQVKKEKLEKYTLGFSPLTFFLALGGVLLVIVSSLLFFRFKKTGVSPPSTVQGVDLQTEIDSLLEQKLNYTQIQSRLIEKGYSPQVVNIEIRKNYYNKKNRQVVK